MNEILGTITVIVTRTDEGSKINKIYKNVSLVERIAIGELMKVESLEELKETKTLNYNTIPLEKEMD